MKQPPKRNYLLLGASLLTAGVIVESITIKVVAEPWSAAQKTLVIMLMILIGYTFADAVLAKAAKGSLTMLQAPFTRIAGPMFGKALFYILIYAVLFVIYLLVFIYGLDISNLTLTQAEAATHI